MSFDWQKYLSLAEYMNVHADDFPDAEACYRSSVSRAYYAAFCVCRNYVRERDGKHFYSDDHQKLQDYLKQKPHDKIRARIGNQLRKLHQDRKKADYDDVLNEKPSSKASKAVIQARKIIDNLSHIS